MNDLGGSVVLAILLTLWGLVSQDYANAQASETREKVSCPVCHYCSVDTAKRECDNYKDGLIKPSVLDKFKEGL